MTPTPPPPDPPPAPEDSGVQGYCRVWMLANGKSGGSVSVDDIHTPHASATVYNVSTYAQLKAARMQSGRRFIRVTGSALLNGAGADYKVTNGTLTEDYSAYTGGGVKDDKVVWQCSDAILTQGKIAPGEGSTVAKSGDRRAFSVNAANGGAVLHGICIDHMSLAWGPDVVGSFINNVEDATVQYSLIGPALYQTNLHPGGSGSNPTGYGFNVTTPGNSDPETIYTKRLTFYRNLSALNNERNLKAEHTLGYDAVNCVVFDWGDQPPVRGNFRGGNIVNNIFKKGPESPGSLRAFEADPVPQYANSTYHSGNLGWTAAEVPFTLDWSQITGAALRATPYDGGPTDADHGPLTVATADASLFADVVVNAGRSYQDAVDATVKAHVIAGTSDGYYNGAGFSAPHPSWS